MPARNPVTDTNFLLSDEQEGGAKAATETRRVNEKISGKTLRTAGT